MCGGVSESVTVPRKMAGDGKKGRASVNMKVGTLLREGYSLLRQPRTNPRVIDW